MSFVAAQVSTKDAVPQMDLQADPAKDPDYARKLSYSLRAQLSQPLMKNPNSNYSPQEHSQHSFQQAYGQVPGAALHPQSSHFQQVYDHHPQQPALSPQGTASGPYSGYASGDWLQGEVKKDVVELKQHVDVFVTRREANKFEGERKALQNEIATLRQRLAGAEDKLGQMEILLPMDNGEFRALRQELNNLEKDCDYYCELSEKEGAARKGAQAAMHEALVHMDEIESEFNKIKQLLDSLPPPAQQQVLTQTHINQQNTQQPGSQQQGQGGAGPQRSASFIIRPTSADRKTAGQGQQGAGGPGDSTSPPANGSKTPAWKCCSFMGKRTPKYLQQQVAPLPRTPQWVSPDVVGRAGSAVLPRVPPPAGQGSFRQGSTVGVLPAVHS